VTTIAENTLDSFWGNGGEDRLVKRRALRAARIRPLSVAAVYSRKSTFFCKAKVRDCVHTITGQTNLSTALLLYSLFKYYPSILATDFVYQKQSKINQPHPVTTEFNFKDSCILGSYTVNKISKDGDKKPFKMSVFIT
jgi:hypothetical protein